MNPLPDLVTEEEPEKTRGTFPEAFPAPNATAVPGPSTGTTTGTLTVVKLVESSGVKITDCGTEPALGMVAGERKAKLPETELDPPLNTEADKD